MSNKIPDITPNPSNYPLNSPASAPVERVKGMDTTVHLSKTGVVRGKHEGKKKPELEPPGLIDEQTVFSAQDKLNDGLQRLNPNRSGSTVIGSNPIASELFQAVMAIFSAQLASFKTEALTGYAEMEIQKETAYQSAQAMKKSAHETYLAGAWSGALGIAGAGVSGVGSLGSLGSMAFSSKVVQGAEEQATLENAQKVLNDDPENIKALEEQTQAQNKLDSLQLTDAEKERISTPEGRKVVFQQQGRIFDYLHTVAQSVGQMGQSGGSVFSGVYQSKATSEQASSRKKDALAALIGSMSNQNMTGSQNCYSVVQGASSILQAYGQMMVSIANTAASH